MGLNPQDKIQRNAPKRLYDYLRHLEYHYFSPGLQQHEIILFAKLQ